ncbi:uncharacterized protein At4g04775-like [Beta vulgaris subsp. vulgaris]|uniref:uncharacterized protein At4g04775-like n=1 Tax=Beta vulgaris subsp. vulgaris TaxID=3555 RepID=UPI0025487115|nr:uncharacterized protein At4g04775-like [Beta vulgaris subsp. vulgaris]
MSRNSYGGSMPPIPKRCHCGFVVTKIRAWTRDNPGRRFVACPDYDAETDTRGCKLFKWCDVEEPIEWQKNVILGLMEEKQELRREVMLLRHNLKTANEKARKIESKYIMLKMKKGGFMCVRAWICVLLVVLVCLWYNI